MIIYLLLIFLGVCGALWLLAALAAFLLDCFMEFNPDRKHDQNR